MIGKSPPRPNPPETTGSYFANWPHPPASPSPATWCAAGSGPRCPRRAATPSPAFATDELTSSRRFIGTSISRTSILRLYGVRLDRNLMLEGEIPQNTGNSEGISTRRQVACEPSVCKMAVPLPPQDEEGRKKPALSRRGPALPRAGRGSSLQKVVLVCARDFEGTK